MSRPFLLGDALSTTHAQITNAREIARVYMRSSSKRPRRER